MNSLNIQRQFERFGGYVHGGYMEKMGQMLNEGQYKKTSLIVEGTAIFDDVTRTGEPEEDGPLRARAGGHRAAGR